MTIGTLQKLLNKRLIQALESDRLDHAEILLSIGADTNYFKSPPPLVRLFKEVTCPIRIAIKKDDPEMMRLLISHGANINKTFEYGSNYIPPIMMCIIFKKYKVLKILAEDIRTDFDKGGIVFSQSSVYAQAQTIKNTEQLLKSGLASQTAKDILKAAAPIRAEKGRKHKQQQIRKTKFGF